MMKSVFAAAMVASAYAGAVELTGKNFDANVIESGKAAFIKFFAPWCGHCKAMKPAWDQLGDGFEGSKTVIIGDVDCSVEKDLCSKYGVRGYPTVKYFTGATAPDGDSYEGGRDYDSLKKFADESLGPSCGPNDRELCSEEQLAKIDEVIALGAETREAQIKQHEADTEAAETFFKDELQKLQDTYKKLQEDKDAKIAEIAPKLKILRSVHAAEAKKAGGDKKDEL